MVFYYTILQDAAEADAGRLRDPGGNDTINNTNLNDADDDGGGGGGGGGSSSSSNDNNNDTKAIIIIITIIIVVVVSVLSGRLHRLAGAAGLRGEPWKQHTTKQQYII